MGYNLVHVEDIHLYHLALLLRHHSWVVVDIHGHNSDHNHFHNYRNHNRRSVRTGHQDPAADTAEGAASAGGKLELEVLRHGHYTVATEVDSDFDRMP